MNKEELRIGNLTEQGEVKSFFENGIHVGFGKCYNFNELEPIPLTEEWHNKFGAKKSGFNSFEYILPETNNLNIKIVFSGDYVFLRQGQGKSYDDDLVSVWNKDLTKREMFVHEWQNLYKSLTNEELTLDR